MRLFHTGDDDKCAHGSLESIAEMVPTVGGLKKKSFYYEQEFWESKDREAVLSKRDRAAIPSARVAGAGLDRPRRRHGERAYGAEARCPVLEAQNPVDDDQ